MCNNNNIIYQSINIPFHSHSDIQTSVAWSKDVNTVNRNDNFDATAVISFVIILVCKFVYKTC